MVAAVHTVLCCLVLTVCSTLAAGYDYYSSYLYADDGLNYTTLYNYDEEEYYHSVRQPTPHEGHVWSVRTTDQQPGDEPATPDSTCTGDTCLTDVDTAPDPLYVYDNCFEDEDGIAYINGTDSCSLLVSGIDIHANLLDGGLDGVYLLDGCYLGKPIYVRNGEDDADSRVLFYNPYYGDWEFSVGVQPSEDQLVAYGDYGYSSPLDVPQWHLSASLNTVESKLMPSPDEDLYFLMPDVMVSCTIEDDHAQEHIHDEL